MDVLLGVFQVDLPMGDVQVAAIDLSLIHIYMCKKLYATNVAAIGQTLAQIDYENVGLAVKYLSAAQRVYCFGQGGRDVYKRQWRR